MEKTSRAREIWRSVIVASVIGIFTAAGVVPVPAGMAEKLTELRVSAIPDENPTELSRIYTPFVEYLAKTLQIPVRYYSVVDYAATVEGLAAKKLDLVWYGGLTFVQAKRRAGAVPLVSRKEDLQFHSKFITRPDSGIKTLADLKGKTFTFGSPGSTSGHLMPRYFLLKNGIVPERDFAHFSYSGAHDATALWVEGGKVDAGALNELVWEKLVQTGKVDTKKVTVFWTTPPYVDYVWTARADLDPALTEKIVKAFLSLDYNKPEDRKLMDLQRTHGYVRVTPKDFEQTEEAGVISGLLK